MVVTERSLNFRIASGPKTQREERIEENVSRESSEKFQPTERERIGKNGRTLVERANGAPLH